MMPSDERPLKILFLLSSHWFTGPAEPSFRLVKGLERRGHRVTMIVTNDPRLGGRIRPAAQEFGVALEPGYVLSRYSPSLADIRDVTRLRRQLLDGSLDVLHAHLSHDNVVASLANAWAGRPAVLVRTRHNYSSTSRRCHAVSWGSRLSSRVLFRRMSDGIIAVSEGIRRETVEVYGVPKEDVFLVRGFVDTEAFAPGIDGSSVRDELGIARDAPVIGIVARMQKHRRHEQFVLAAERALAAVPACRFLIVGRGKHQPAIQAMVKDKGLQDRIFFTGFRGQDFKAVLSCLDAKVFLTPGSDGTCRAILEAMACAKPILAYRTGDLHEVVEDGQTGILCQDDDPNALSDGMILLAKDSALRQRLGQAGREKAVRCYGIERAVKETEWVYRHLMSRAQGRAARARCGDDR
jgi:glycosyltransferase involved in cell wall biosynthesis